MEQIKKVIVVHKTHLDIGFTDFSKNVLNQYVNQFIPAAIETAKQCNQKGEKNFVWTVGSFLIDYHLRNAANPTDLIEAIEKGDIAWHAMALTTHTELMDPRLFNYSLGYSKALDKRFSKNTMAGKMTDVPCHTHAMVPLLKQAGIQYLHIGVNESSKLPQLPPISRLRYGEDEILLHYAGAYGKADVCGNCALEFAHTADNMGPPTPQRVLSEMARLKTKYPGAEVVSGTLDDFAREAVKSRESFPVITSELGDTWIHGTGTDPYKVGAYMALLRARDSWLKSDPAAEHSPGYQALMDNLLLICEHTWGMDSKRYFSDYRNWDKASFKKARAKDTITKEDILPAGEVIAKDALAMETLPRLSYSTLEASWAEQREYVTAALKAFPDPFRLSLNKELSALRPTAPETLGSETTCRGFDMAGYAFTLMDDGALEIHSVNGVAKQDIWLGRFQYSVFSASTMKQCYETYNRSREDTFVWSYPDFGKPGLDSAPAYKDCLFLYTISKTLKTDHTLQIFLRAPKNASEAFGAPRQAVVTYRFSNAIHITLQWFDKDASRIPEMLTFSMNLGFTSPNDLRLYKLSSPIDPYDVVKGGNCKLHCSPHAAYQNASVTSLQAPLLSVGGLHLYDTDDTYGHLKDGIAYVLYNNRWNTNFRLWYEENAAFDFHITL